MKINFQVYFLFIITEKARATVRKCIGGQRRKGEVQRGWDGVEYLLLREKARAEEKNYI